jgi:lysophospholipase L1-like esterase
MPDRAHARRCTPIRRLRPAAWLAAAALLIAAGPARGEFLPASDARFRYEGRFDLSDPGAPVVIWQASRILIDFEGDTLGLRFSDASDQCFFNATIDGRTSRVGLRSGKPAEGETFAGLGSGRHSLELFKRSEASAGRVRFLGIDLAPGDRAWAAPAPAYRLAVEFIGDSITAGACDEDGAADQWDDRSTHNNATSYGALVCRALGADYRNIAVSGMGVAMGWTSVKAGEVWDRLYPTADSAKAPPDGWVPAVVFVNLGENDDSYPHAHHLPFPAAFADRYVDLVHAVRRAWPSATIVALRGGMYGGSQSQPLIQAWAAAVSRLEADDPRVSHYVFRHWTPAHPRDSDHRAMADELVAWLAAQGFMRGYPLAAAR